MMEAYRRVENKAIGKISYGSSFNRSMICYNDEQEAETSIV